MEPKAESVILRRSKRLRNVSPELSGLVGPERTPPKTYTASKNSKTKAREASSDEESSDEDGAEDLIYEYGAKVCSGANGHCLSNKREMKTSHPSMRSKTSHTSHVSGSRGEDDLKIPSLIKNQTNRAKIVQRKSSDCAVQEAECVRSSFSPLTNEILPTTHVLVSNFQLKRQYSLLLLIFVIVLVYICCVVPLFTYRLPERRCDSNNLEQQFPKQTNKLWNYVKVGRSVSEKPFVLLLVHDDNDHDVASCLAQQIARDVACHRTGEAVTHKVIDGSKGVEKMHLVSMKESLENTKALVVLHVEDLTPDVATFFHYILDVEEPWVSGGVYVLTLHLPNIHAMKQSSRNVYSAVREFLFGKWSGHIKEDRIDPLITRFGNYEYVVKEDSNKCDIY